MRDAVVEKYFITEEWEKDYDNQSAEVKAISDYTGIDFNNVLELPYSLYLLYRKDAWLYGNLRSQKGREFLKDLVRFKTTEADLQAVRKFKGGAI